MFARDLSQLPVPAFNDRLVQGVGAEPRKKTRSGHKAGGREAVSQVPCDQLEPAHRGAGGRPLTAFHY
jgi:hypothetical protein